MEVYDVENTLCMYNGRRITVADYLSKSEVRLFESRLKELAYKSAQCDSQGNDVATGETYAPLRKGFPFHDYRRCLYFENYVLPMDQNLQADYWGIAQGGRVGQSVMLGKCKRCSQEFNKKAKNQVYCNHCKDYLEKEKKRRYYHKNKTE